MMQSYDLDDYLFVQVLKLPYDILSIFHLLSSVGMLCLVMFTFITVQ